MSRLELNFTSFFVFIYSCLVFFTLMSGCGWAGCQILLIYSGADTRVVGVVARRPKVLISLVYWCEKIEAEAPPSTAHKSGKFFLNSMDSARVNYLDYVSSFPWDSFISIIGKTTYMRNGMDCLRSYYRLRSLHFLFTQYGGKQKRYFHRSFDYPTCFLKMDVQ